MDALLAAGNALLSFENLAALLALTALEIVLGIDNIVFLSILTARVEPERQASVRTAGLALAMILRVVLLFGISWIVGLTTTLFSVLGHPVSGKDLVLLAGGLFLVAKGTTEIHQLVEGTNEAPETGGKGRARAGAILAQIAVMDMVFSLDSVITAVGMTRQIPIMIVAVVVAILVMMFFAGPIARFVESHQPIKTLALAFLVLVGVLLVADGLHQHLPRGYVYFAMVFSLVVELLNLRAAAKRKAAAATD